MKKVTRAMILLGYMLIFALGVFADNPPDPGGDPTGDPVGGGSPLGSGLLFMLIASLIYGFRKFRSQNIKQQ